MLGMDRDPVPKFKAFVRIVFVLFMALYHVFKSMEQLSFDSPTRTDVVRRFLSFTKVFLSASAM